MSESAEKTSMFGDAPPHAGGTHQGSSSNDPAGRDPTTNTPSQILLEALQNFVIPLIQTGEGRNKKDIGPVHSMGPEAGKLLAALQEFISSMIVQLQVGQTQSIKVELDDPDVDSVSSNDAMVKSPGVATESKVSDPGPVKAFIPQLTNYQYYMGRLQEVVREHVFSKMPIRVLHFTDTPRDSGTKLQITLLDRNGVCDCVIKEIHERKISDATFPYFVQKYSKYAILSHTWLRGSDSEVTYGAWRLRQFDTQQPGYQKLASFCRSAWKDHSLSFGWMDTVCINKDSSSELDESIRSMYKWYKNSTICITYLAETVALDDVHRDPWFTRGWTFQELLAPDHMSFYNKDWKKFVPYTYLGDKDDMYILDQISKATTITKDELDNCDELPISRKMQLAAMRNVMREEDTAYSLMGICGVSISIAYGEGAKRAFFRLMQEVLNTSSEVVDIFNCAQTRGRFSIIPLEPSAYQGCSKDIMRMSHYTPIEPLLLTHVGLRMPILLIPSLQKNDPCFKHEPIGDYYATLEFKHLFECYHLLDKGIVKSTAKYKQTFGILNFGGDTTTLHVLDLCLAIWFRVNREEQVEWGSTSSWSKIHRIGTDKPIAFHFMNRTTPTSGEGQTVYSIKRSDLAKHGMTLETMYL